VILTRSFDIETQGNADVLEITGQVIQALRDDFLNEGLVTVSVIGSTAGLTTIVYEPGLVEDIKSCFERLVPQNMRYCHEDTWHDGIGHSHVRSALLKTSLSIPFLNRKLLLGTWQQVSSK
jgi:secondary thiamine-phosphate synthase enzyme